MTVQKKKIKIENKCDEEVEKKVEKKAEINQKIKIWKNRLQTESMKTEKRKKIFDSL